MKKILCYLLLSLGQLSLMANPHIKIYDTKMILCHQESNEIGSLKEYVEESESINKWTSLVAIRYLKNQTDPEKYIRSMGKAYAKKFPECDFSMGKNEKDKAYFIDYMMFPENGEKYVEWNFFKVIKGNEGIVVYQYAKKLFFKKKMTEIHDLMRTTRSDFVDYLAMHDFLEHE